MNYVTAIKNKLSILIHKGAVHILAGNFVNKFVNLFGTICLVRILTKSEYGLLGYAENIYGFLYIFVGMGLSNSVLRYVILAQNDLEKKAIYNYVITLGTIFNTGIVVLGLLISSLYTFPSDFADSKELFQIMMFVIPFTYFIEVALSNERAFLNNSAYVYISIISSATIVFSKLMGATLSGVRGVVFYFCIAEIIMSIGLTLYEKRKYYCNINNIKLSKKLKKSIVSYGFQFMLTHSLWSLFLLLDVFLIGNLTGNSIEVAEYKVAYTIPACLSIFSGAVSTFINPYFIKNENNKTWIKKNYILCSLVTLVIVAIISLLIIVFAKYIILLFYGDKYLSTIGLMRVLLIGAIINSGFRAITANILAALGLVKYNLIISFIAICMLIPLDLILIPQFGNMGAAISDICVFSFMAIYLFVIFNRYYHVVK